MKMRILGQAPGSVISMKQVSCGKVLVDRTLSAWTSFFKLTSPPNPGLQYCRWILYHLSHQGSPDIYVCVYLVTLCNSMDCSLPGSSVHWDSPSKNTGVGCYALLQGYLPSGGSNPGLPYCRQILYHLSHQGSPNALGPTGHS